MPEITTDRPRLNPIGGLGSKTNNSIKSHAVTLRYQTAARELDRFLGSPGIANWFHFATWGTFNVGEVIRMGPEMPLADCLIRGEKLIFHSAMQGLSQFLLGGPVTTTSLEVNKAFKFYENGEWLNATLELMYHEQWIVDDCLHEGFNTLWPFSPEILTKSMTINYPHRQLLVAQDVPGFPGTAVDNWLEYDKRVAWMAAEMEADLHSEAMIKGSPYG